MVGGRIQRLWRSGVQTGERRELVAPCFSHRLNVPILAPRTRKNGALLVGFIGEKPREVRLSILFFYCLDIQTSPQIPAGNRAIRGPWFRDFLHHGGLGPLTLLVVLLDGSLHAVIADRKNVRMPQGEHQKHVSGPDANAFDLS